MFRYRTAFRMRAAVCLAISLGAVWAVPALARARAAAPADAVRLAMLTDAARAGEVWSQFELAERYARGDGVDQDMREAVLWWIQAARQAHPEAAARLADAIDVGEHLPRDPVRAQSFRRRAAEWGSADAQWRMAGAVEDPEEAMEWLRRAADGGQPDAAHALGQHYEEGKQVDADPARAMALYRRAAVAGHASAANTLGVLLAEGAGGSPELAAAYFWFEVATRRGVSTANRNRAAVAERLPGREQRRIRRRAVRFLAGAGEPPDG